MGSILFAFGQNQEIVLKNERIDIKPQRFYIKNITDERADKATVLLTGTNSSTHQQEKYTADFKGGTLLAVQQFIAFNDLNIKNTGFSLIVRIKKFSDTEVVAGNKVQGHILLTISFDADRGEDEVLHLTDYNGHADYTRGTGPVQNVEPILRQILASSFLYIDTWMNREVERSIKLATAVKVIVTDYTEKPEGDTIYYNAKRPLNWSDFQSKTGSSKFDAEVFPTMGYDEQTEVIKGTVVIHIAMKVSLPKSACWVKGDGQSSYALNHEQRHFDIAKIAAIYFEQKLNSAHLPVNNYDGFINVDYLDAYREMTDMQKKYDEETRHGSDESAQHRWNDLIDSELTLVHNPSLQ
ncbi:hypothetical protein HDF24_10350 [Mucilaginibacter sp. X4EP1]|uniref:hypothetical protein n=1 Tax=Mucilaginibacter sp. X4EP1 TaxID=2723092 RepID=UPI002169C16C|nr:hypothetical protein [Mucilaginibacter sp. X4EP1]MCS3816315.1 hypothetical protein [Mucilaginibacter sp. X4EP1]